MEGKKGEQMKAYNWKTCLSNCLIRENKENVLGNKQWRQPFLFSTLKNKTRFWADKTEEMKQWVMFHFAVVLLSAAVGMNRSRSSWDNKALHSPVIRITRSSGSQARHTDPTETLESGPGPYRKQRKKQTDSVLAQDLSQMSVSGLDSLPARWGHRNYHGKVTCRWNLLGRKLGGDHQ